MHSTLKDLALDRITVVYPGNDTYPLTPNIDVTNLAALAGGAA